MARQATDLRRQSQFEVRLPRPLHYVHFRPLKSTPSTDVTPTQSVHIREAPPLTFSRLATCQDVLAGHSEEAMDNLIAGYEVRVLSQPVTP